MRVRFQGKADRRILSIWFRCLVAQIFPSSLGVKYICFSMCRTTVWMCMSQFGCEHLGKRTSSNCLLSSNAGLVAALNVRPFKGIFCRLVNGVDDCIGFHIHLPVEMMSPPHPNVWHNAFCYSVGWALEATILNHKIYKLCKSKIIECQHQSKHNATTNQLCQAGNANNFEHYLFVFL